MSTDKSVTQDLILTLEDGKAGFAKAGEKAAEAGNPEVAGYFYELSNQREGFAKELVEMAADYGDETEEHGSLGGAIHRGWMTIKDAIGGSSVAAVLDVAVQGEAHAVKLYEEALAEEISPDLRRVVVRQLAEVRTAAQRVLALQSMNA